MNSSSVAFDYMSLLKGYIPAPALTETIFLIIKTKEECINREINPSDVGRVYELLVAMADRIKVRNAFSDQRQFEKVCSGLFRIEGEPDWEYLVYESYRHERYSFVSNALFNEYLDRFPVEAQSILIAEGDKFMPNLKKLVESHPDCKITITAENDFMRMIMERILNASVNVNIQMAGIYSYGFTNERFDAIFAAPHFGTRSLAADENFMTRDLETVAFENLLLHLSGTGKIIITMPARITFAQGKIGEFRRFVQQTYRLLEISELPEGIFESTGIKTYILDVENSRPGDEDIIIRRYKASERSPRMVMGLKVEDETFVMSSELEELGDWNINKIFSLQDEDWLRLQKSSVRKMMLGDVADVFRGKAITSKDPNGSIAVVNIANIGDYDIDYDSLDHIDTEERKVINYLLQEGDVLIPARGTAIRTTVFKEQTFQCIASSNVIVIRPHLKDLNSVYLKLFLDSDLGRKLVSGVQQGNAIINISYNDFKALEIPVPPIDEQNAKAEKYMEEYCIYKSSIESATSRWKNVLNDLGQF